MVQEFSSELLEIRRETHDVLSFFFSTPDGFSFLPGQYVMLEIKGDDRSLSVSSSPAEKGFIRVTKKITDGEFSKILVDLKEGDAAKIRGPYGSFVLDTSESAIMLAGGIGITPLMSMIKYAAENNLSNKVTLFYSNKTPEDVAFREELEEAAGENKNIKIIDTVTRPEKSKIPWAGLAGRIDEAMIRQNTDMKGLFYICGPPAMVDAMIQTVKNLGIEQERIKTEKFTGY